MIIPNMYVQYEYPIFMHNNYSTYIYIYNTMYVMHILGIGLPTCTVDRI